MKKEEFLERWKVHLAHLGDYDNDPGKTEPEFLADLDALLAGERGNCAKLLDLNNSQILLMAGEMTAGELRSVRAVLKSRAQAIRSGGTGK